MGRRGWNPSMKVPAEIAKITLKQREDESEFNYAQRVAMYRANPGRLEKEKKHKEIKMIRAKCKRYYTRVKKTNLLVRSSEKLANYLKYYSVIMAWSEVKFAMDKDEIEFGFLIYDSPPMNREQYASRAFHLIDGDKMFTRFRKKGYISRIRYFDTAKDRWMSHPHYELSQEFKIRLLKVYKMIEKLEPIYVNSVIDPIPPQTMEIIREMNEEVEDIKKGRKTADVIVFNEYQAETDGPTED